MTGKPPARGGGGMPPPHHGQFAFGAGVAHHGCGIIGKAADDVHEIVEREIISLSDQRR